MATSFHLGTSATARKFAKIPRKIFYKTLWGGKFSNSLGQPPDSLTSFNCIPYIKINPKAVGVVPVSTRFINTKVDG